VFSDTVNDFSGEQIEPQVKGCVQGSANHKYASASKGERVFIYGLFISDFSIDVSKQLDVQVTSQEIDSDWTSN
jgi:hypothetical protein